MGIRNMMSGSLLMLMMFCCVRSDFEQDKKDCQTQLISLSPCIDFVSGEAKLPPPSCCTQLRNDATKSKLCLCILIKDRNEPDLGFKLNVTLASGLLSICQIQSEVATCPELLHMAPSSPEAQVFEQLGNYTGVGNSSSSPGDITQSWGSKLTVKGLLQATMYGVLALVLRPEVIGCI